MTTEEMHKVDGAMYWVAAANSNGEVYEALESYHRYLLQQIDDLKLQVIEANENRRRMEGEAQTTKEDLLFERAIAAEEVAWMLWQQYTLGMGEKEYKETIRTVRGRFNTNEAALCFNKMLKVIAGEF